MSAHPPAVSGPIESGEGFECKICGQKFPKGAAYYDGGECKACHSGEKKQLLNETKISERREISPSFIICILLCTILGLSMVLHCYEIFVYHRYRSDDVQCERQLALWNGVTGIVVVIGNAVVIILGLSNLCGDCRDLNMPVFILFVIFNVFYFSWLIVGSVWVYPPTSGIDFATSACNQSLWTWTFWNVTAQWLGFAVELALSVSILVLVWRPMTR